MGYRDQVDFNVLVGKTLAGIYGSEGDESLTFTTVDGEEFVMYYEHDCCASCSVEDICGDLNDLIGSPIVQAEESTSGDNPPDADPELTKYQESFTWTFYRLATIKGSVVIRWYGSSNGYYSESVSFEKRGQVN
jgi:hypothetical protein